MTKPLRQTMPTVAAWIDAHRDTFGITETNDAIRAGMAGQGTFWAKENGEVVGTCQPTQKNAPAARRCILCGHWRRPGMSAGYCATRQDLPRAYGQRHPLRHLPLDGGANCQQFEVLQ